MRSLHTGHLPAPFTCLLCLAAAPALADDPPNNTPNTPGGAKTALANTYIIDRSPMAGSAEAQTNEFSATPGQALDYLKTPTPGGSFVMVGVPQWETGRPVRGDALKTRQLAVLDRFKKSLDDPDDIPDTLIVSTAAHGPIATTTSGAAPRPPRTPTVRRFFAFLNRRYSKANQTNLLLPIIEASRKQLEAISDGPMMTAPLSASPGPMLNLGGIVVAMEQKRLLALITFLAHQYAKDEKPLRRDVFAVEEQARWFDKQNASAQSLTYSSNHLRTDFVGQFITGTYRGYGAALRHALDGYKPPPDPKKVITRILRGVSALPPTEKIRDEDILKALQNPIVSNQMLDDIIAEVNKSIADIKPTLAKYLLTPHFGIGGDFQHLNGVGDYYDAGISESGLRPIRVGHRTGAIYYGIGLRYQWFDADAGSGAKSVRDFGNSALLAWQDNAPHLNADKTTNLGRWHTRIGVEYAPRNALTRGDYEAFFLRFRDRQIAEYTFLIGNQVNGQAFFGFNASLYFGGAQRPDTTNAPDSE